VKGDGILLHEIFLCQDQLDEIARRTQPLVIKKRGSYAYTRTMEEYYSR